MPDFGPLVLGEHRRALDQRYRLSLPLELLEPWGPPQTAFTLAKERPGCLSLWPTDAWQDQLGQGVQVIQAKLAAGRLGMQMAEVQALGRLLSTRHRSVQLAGRGRLTLPEGFREFLAVEPGDEVFVVGAAVCIEIWQPAAWSQCLAEQIPRFDEILQELSQ